MIVFYDGNSNELIGTVKRVGDALVADVDALREFETDVIEDVEIFLNQFSAWSNGYLYSFEMSDEETPEPIYKPKMPKKTSWSAAEIKEAYENFKNSKGDMSND